MPVLYLDLDGVFADYDGAVNALMSKTDAENPSRRWKILDRVPNLFLNLDVLPGSLQMFSYIMANRYPGWDVKFLTALPKKTRWLGCAEENKREWIRTNLISKLPLMVDWWSEFEIICCDGWESKANYYNDGDVLLDDAERNCDSWPGNFVWHDSKNIKKSLTSLAHFGIINY